MKEGAIGLISTGRMRPYQHFTYNQYIHKANISDYVAFLFKTNQKPPISLRINCCGQQSPHGLAPAQLPSLITSLQTPLPQLQAHCPYCWSPNTPVSFLPLGPCTCCFHSLGNAFCRSSHCLPLLITLQCSVLTSLAQNSCPGPSQTTHLPRYSLSSQAALFSAQYLSSSAN